MLICKDLMAVGRILMVDGRMDQNVVLYVYVGGVGLMRVCIETT